MSLWFSGVMGVSVAAFRKQIATQSGRSGGASAASNGGVPAELWGQHGDKETLDAQKRYEERQDMVVVDVAGGHAPSDGHGAGCADRMRFRGRPAACGG